MKLSVGCGSNCFYLLPARKQDASRYRCFCFAWKYWEKSSHNHTQLSQRYLLFWKKQCMPARKQSSFSIAVRSTCSPLSERHLHFVLFSCTSQHNSIMPPLRVPKSKGNFLYEMSDVYCASFYLSSQMGLCECNEGFIRRCECWIRQWQTCDSGYSFLEFNYWIFIFYYLRLFLNHTHLQVKLKCYERDYSSLSFDGARFILS